MKREEELKRLAREQQQLQQEAQEMAKQLSRLRSERASQSLAQAAAQMGLALAVSRGPWWLMLVVAWAIGSSINIMLFQLGHELGAQERQRGEGHGTTKVFGKEAGRSLRYSARKLRKQRAGDGPRDQRQREIIEIECKLQSDDAPGNPAPGTLLAIPRRGTGKRSAAAGRE